MKYVHVCVWYISHICTRIHVHTRTRPPHMRASAYTEKTTSFQIWYISPQVQQVV